MKKLLLFIGIFLSLDFGCACGATTNPEDLCRKIAQADFKKAEIISHLGKINYIGEYSSKELADKFPERAVKNQDMLGLTAIALEYSVILHINKYKMSDGSFCVYPKNVQVNIGYSNPTIYLSSDLKKGSCVYKRTLRHEWQHLVLIYIYFQQYIHSIKRNLSSGPQILVTKKTETADNLLQQKYSETIEKIHSANMEKLMEFEKQLDSFENYQNEGNLCKSDE